MALIDLILNGICLLLWVNWRSRTLISPGRAPAIALVSTLKRVEAAPRDRWSSPMALAVILVLRAIFYRQVGPATQWQPSVSLEAIVLHFRSDMFAHMLLFSALGFLLWLTTFYFSLLLVAAVNRPSQAVDPWQSLVRAHLGWAARLPAWLMLLLPLIATFVFWLILEPVLGAMQVLLPTSSLHHLAGQALVIGFGGWMLWQYAIMASLVLHIVASYVYLGNAPFWSFINATVRGLIRPIRWLPLRAGKVELAPIVALIVVVLIGTFAPARLTWLYSRLPT